MSLSTPVTGRTGMRSTILLTAYPVLLTALVAVGAYQQNRTSQLFDESLVVAVLKSVPTTGLLTSILLLGVRIPGRVLSILVVLIVGLVVAPPMAYFASSGAHLSPDSLFLAQEADLGQLLQVVGARISPHFLVLALAPVILGVVAIGTRRTHGARSEYSLRTAVVLVVAFLTCEIFLGRQLAHPVSGLLHGFPLWAAKSPNVPDMASSRIECPPGSNTYPDVVIVAIESFGSQFRTAKGEDGQPIMPHLNSLAAQSVDVENFYAGSMFTLKGHESLILGVTPSLRGPVAVNSGSNGIASLASAMNECGYATAFYQASANIRFARTDLFLQRAGFGRIKAMDGDFVNWSHADSVWGWGLQDDVFYDMVLDDLSRNVLTNSGKPAFAFVATISNHQPFAELPRSLWTAYPNPTNMMQRYVNSIRASDEFLGAFVQKLRGHPRLKDCLLVVTADHSFSFGENGEPDVERSFYERTFRIPLVIQWPGNLPARKISSGQYAQKDVPATVLSLMGNRCLASRFGESILDVPAAGRPAAFVQPYSGGFVAVVDHPYKLVHSVGRNRDALVNLAADPLEATNCIGEMDPAKLAQMRRIVSEVLCETDIWKRLQP